MTKSKMANRYSPEVRARAVRMVFEHQGSYDFCRDHIKIDNEPKSAKFFEGIGKTCKTDFNVLFELRQIHFGRLFVENKLELGRCVVPIVHHLCIVK